MTSRDCSGARARVLDFALRALGAVGASTPAMSFSVPAGSQCHGNIRSTGDPPCPPSRRHCGSTTISRRPSSSTRCLPELVRSRRSTAYTEAGPGTPGEVVSARLRAQRPAVHRHQRRSAIPVHGGGVVHRRLQDQDEVDYYWDRLVDGGEESQCGWLKDRFGLSWQIVPDRLNELTGDPDPARATAATKAMLGHAQDRHRRTRGRGGRDCRRPPIRALTSSFNAPRKPVPERLGELHRHAAKPASPACRVRNLVIYGSSASSHV